MSKINGIELNKRTRLTGMDVQSTCPKCGKVIHRDGNKEYLGYPVTGEESEIFFSCEDGHEEVAWILKVDVELIVTPKRIELQ